MKRIVFCGTIFLNIIFAAWTPAVADERAQAPVSGSVRTYSGVPCEYTGAVPTPEWEIRCGLFPLKQAIGLLMEHYIEPPDFTEMARIAFRAGAKHIGGFTYREDAVKNLDTPFESVWGANEDYVPNDWQMERLAVVLAPLAEKLREAHTPVEKTGSRAFELLLKETRDAAIAAIIEKLHPHTDYYALGSKERKNLLTSKAETRKGGKGFGGIGAIIGEFGPVYVIMPLPGTPAGFKLQRYDEIFAVDDVPVATPQEAVSKIRGEAGTPVTLSIRRNGLPQDIMFVRETIKSQSAVGALYRVNNIAICNLFISHFAEETDKEIGAIFADGGSCAAADTYVLDLRSNGGGFASTAMETAQKLLPKTESAGQELLLQFKNSKALEQYFRDSTVSLRNWKIRPVILQGPGTASGAELVIGVLRRFATLIGGPTFGKFSAYLETVLADGAILTVTGSMFSFQDGVNYDGRGFFPDIQFSRSFLQRRASPEKIKREENLPRFQGKIIQHTEDEKLFLFLGERDPELAIAFGLIAYPERFRQAEPDAVSGKKKGGG